MGNESCILEKFESSSYFTSMEKEREREILCVFVRVRVRAEFEKRAKKGRKK